ncbi:MAG: hypothetical protein IJU66_07120 [Oscillospiraceae bacterium]|nr:hypothetical protein [Oscillospiraceae bacterium]
MRNTGTRGYTGYRGRRSNGKRWVAALLVLLLLAALASLAAQHYMVYDKDGSYHFELPWMHFGKHVEKTQLRGARPQLEIVIEQPDAPPVIPLHAQELDASALAPTVSRALKALPKDVNAVAVRLKDASGMLLYPSALSEAREAGAVSGDAAGADAIKELTGSGYYTIARVSALHDSKFSAAHKADAAIQQKKYGGELWYAPDSTFYLAPEKELTRQYLAKIAGELAALGFDELLFDDFGYPAVGRLNNIQTSGREMTQEAALALLADNLRDPLLGTSTKISVVMDEKTVLAGSDAKSGQVLAELAVRFDRIYVPTTEEKVPELLEALAPYTAELVPILSSAPAEGAYLISQ